MELVAESALSRTCANAARDDLCDGRCTDGSLRPPHSMADKMLSSVLDEESIPAISALHPVESDAFCATICFISVQADFTRSIGALSSRAQASSDTCSRHSAPSHPHSPTVVGGVMRHFFLGTAMASVVFVFAGCSRSTSKAHVNELASRSEPHWEGGIRPMQPRTGAAEPSSPPSLFDGTAQLTRSGGDISRTYVHIHLSTPGNGSSVYWALASGRCGNLESPVLPISSFNPLEVGSNGMIDATEEIPFEFPTDGMFHLDIFGGHSARLTEVVACANLSYKAK